MKIHGYAALHQKAPLSPFSYDAPALGPTDILIRITHSGLCYTDVYMIDNAWNRSTYPLLPGHEIVGIVVQKGSQAACNLGDRVGVSWVRSSCLACPECLQGETNVCQNKTGIYNKGRFGGFADHVIADSRFSFLIPHNLDSAHAAPLLCAGATVYAPAVRHRLQPRQSVGVIGIGGLGHLALQFYCAMGCIVSAISSTAAKEAEAKRFGAEHFYTFKDPPKPLQFDFLLCTADADLDWNALLSWLRPNGILCLVSRPLQGLRIDPAYLVSTQRTICGSNNASRSVLAEMLSFAARHGIKPQIELMPMSKINEALEKIRRNQVRYRIVLTP